MKLILLSRWDWLAISAVILAGVLLLLLGAQHVCWVGGTDLEIECIVTDALTGEPIKGASIHVTSKGGFCDEGKKQEFSLVTNADGSVKRLAKGCMCSGTSGVGVNTYFVHLPSWRYQASADGYISSEWTQLDVPENVSQVQRGKPAATLAISIQLTK